ncbi:MAG: hypothetical protein AAF498_16115 [Pseudomonadota bacterium]
MTKPIFANFATSLIALSVAAACATNPSANSATASGDQPQKPTAEQIEIAERADPLTRANFWNAQYNQFPTDPEIAVAFSESLREISSFERAAEIANLAAVSHPGNYDVVIEVARAEQDQGNLLQAVRAYAAAAELRPDDATPYAAVGAIYDAEGEHEAAQIAYGEALEIDPNRPATLSNFGLSLALSGDLVGAEYRLRQATALEGATAQVRQNLALILALQGKFVEARDVARIDAAEYIADRNIDFVAQMIGQNAQLEEIANNALSGEELTVAATVPEAEVPIAAPTAEVQTESIGEPTELASQEPRRPRLRGTLSGGR